jgi:chemotaxis protein histidine kinase CheA
MTTYKCNICDNEVFGKVSGLKRHQTRKHSGVSDLAIIEVLEDGTENVIEVAAKQPIARKKAASRKRKAAPSATVAAEPKAKAESQKVREITVQRQTENSVTIDRELFDVLMKLAGVPTP